jgi:hypothetical protein
MMGILDFSKTVFMPQKNSLIHSLLSLQPLVIVLKRMIAEGKPGAKKLYQGLIQELESKSYLLQSMQDTTPLVKDAELVETLLSTIFPPATASNQGIYAVAFPFRLETVYASPSFKKLFLNEGTTAGELASSEDVELAMRRLAYDLILKKFFGHEAVTSGSTVLKSFDEPSGLTSYYEVSFNAQFIDVFRKDENTELPSGLDAQQTIDLEEINRVVPLSQFRFEGLLVLEITDVTQEQVITEIKNLLLNINSLADAAIFDDLQLHVKSLIGLSHVRIGITPFFRSNNYFLYTESLYRNSLLFRNEEVVNKKEEINELCQNVFEKSDLPLFFDEVKSDDPATEELLQYYRSQGAQDLILCPLKDYRDHLIGLLEIASDAPDQLQKAQLSRILPAVQLFSLALEKSGENLELQVDKVIKEHFTAIQPAVEWKFTEAAFYYLQLRQVSEIARMPNISFENVHPLYAAIDIRNSSIERNKSIQKDLLEQLGKAGDVLEKACQPDRLSFAS